MSEENPTSLRDEDIATASAEAAAPMSVCDVRELISSVLNSLEGDMSAGHVKLYRELDDLAGYIQAARSEIASLRPDDIAGEHIPTATDELEAIVGATEDAAGKIMDAAEMVETASEQCDPDTAQKLIDAVTQIFEACNFQDLTGQRITKVVKTLQHIEWKVDQLLASLGDDQARTRMEARTFEEALVLADKREDSDLLNGPQLPDNAMDQDEIDKLLASFD